MTKRETKKIILSNGVELSYEEYGVGNKETMIMGQFYYDTFQRWVNAMAEKFHIYAVIMRFDGKTTFKNADGKTNWAEQWGEDIYQFSRAIGADKFLYVGKCHGSVPGWYLVDCHPEVLKGFVIGSLLPPNRIPKPPKPEMLSWGKALASGNPDLMRAGLPILMRSQDRIEEKLQEIMNADVSGISSSSTTSMPLLNYKTNEQLADFYSKIKLPVLLLYGTEYPGLDDEMLLLAVKTIPQMKAVIFQGERHFYEIDIPEKLADEVKLFATQISR